MYLAGGRRLYTKRSYPSSAAVVLVVFQPVFLKSAAGPRDFPADRGREVAVAGRSNSGKSSAINALVGSKKLARTSKTPGRTQLINFFGLGAERRLVDLPGYGFARVPPEVRERWRTMIEAYFEQRNSLAGLVVTVDIRRGVSPLDADMLAYAGALELPALVLLTKADKLSRGAALNARQRAEPNVAASVEVFSAPQRLGVAESLAHIEAWLAGVSA